MKKYRYCDECDKGTIQHSEKRFLDQKTGVADRLFLSVISLGVFEVCLEKVWVCSECGEETE